MPKATALAAITCISSPPCRPGNTARGLLHHWCRAFPRSQETHSARLRWPKGSLYSSAKSPRIDTHQETFETLWLLVEVFYTIKKPPHGNRIIGQQRLSGRISRVGRKSTQNTQTETGISASVPRNRGFCANTMGTDGWETNDWRWAQSAANPSPLALAVVSLLSREKTGNFRELSLNHTFFTLYEADFLSAFGRIP